MSTSKWIASMKVTRRYGLDVDVKLQFDNRLPGPLCQVLMCKTKNCAGKSFFWAVDRNL
jgi:hypothetical protein